MKNEKHRRFLCILFTIIIVLVPVWIFNNFTIKNTEETIYSEKITNDIRITLISDLHGSIFGNKNSTVIKKVKNNNPDLIFVLGDMYSKNQTNDIDRTVSFIEKLTEISPVYIITGDHDTDDEYKEKLKASKSINYLAYDKADISVNGNQLCIYGIDNVYLTPTFNLNREFLKPDEDKLNILLAHIPSVEHYRSFNADIIFSGDTHGGLIRLPFLGPLYYIGYILPKITCSEEMTDKGLYKFDSTSLFVTSGLGNYPLPIRFNNRPEICTITITKGD